MVTEEKDELDDEAVPLSKRAAAKRRGRDLKDDELDSLPPSSKRMKVDDEEEV